MTELYLEEIISSKILESDGHNIENRFLSFKIDKEDYGIPLKNVMQIIEFQKIFEIPNMPDYVKGVITLRGKLIPVIDLRKRLNIAAKEYGDRNCIVVVSLNNYKVGLIVDSVEEVLEIGIQNIESLTKFIEEKPDSEFICGLGKVGEKVNLILDLEKIIVKETH